MVSEKGSTSGSVLWAQIVDDGIHGIRPPVAAGWRDLFDEVDPIGDRPSKMGSPDRLLQQSVGSRRRCISRGEGEAGGPHPSANPPGVRPRVVGLASPSDGMGGSQVCTNGQHRLGARLAPAHAGPLEAVLDQVPGSRFDRSGANRQPTLAEGWVVHAVLIGREVAALDPQDLRRPRHPVRPARPAAAAA